MHSRLRARLFSLVLAIAFVFGTRGPALSAAPVLGEAVYQRRCACCHDSGDARIPRREELKKLSVTSILRKLDFGEMSNIATPLRREERDAGAAYLGVASGSGAPSAKAYCKDRTVKVATPPKFGWNGWSPTITNTRYQPGKRNDLRQLRVCAGRRAGGQRPAGIRAK